MTKGFFKELGRSLRGSLEEKPNKAARMMSEAFSRTTVGSTPSLVWNVHQNPSRLVKQYKFDSSRGMNDFICELREYEQKTGHRGSILMENMSLTVEVNTGDLGGVTEIDYDYAKTADDIFHDIGFYK